MNKYLFINVLTVTFLLFLSFNAFCNPLLKDLTAFSAAPFVAG